MAELTEWLRLMLDEIARKREDGKQAAAEQIRRTTEAPTGPAPNQVQTQLQDHDQGHARGRKHKTVGK